MNLEQEQIYNMSEIEELIRQILSKGISITEMFVNEHNTLSFKISGFYKSDTVEIYELDNKIYCKQRYGEVRELSENPFKTLVEINFKWWNYSKHKSDFWELPDSQWKDSLIEYGLLSLR